MHIGLLFGGEFEFNEILRFWGELDIAEHQLLTYFLKEI